MVGGPTGVGNVDTIIKGLQQARELIGNNDIPHFVTEWSSSYEAGGGACMLSVD